MRPASEPASAPSSSSRLNAPSAIPRFVIVVLFRVGAQDVCWESRLLKPRGLSVNRLTRLLGPHPPVTVNRRGLPCANDLRTPTDRDAADRLPVLGRAPELAGVEPWFNTPDGEPLRLAPFGIASCCSSSGPSRA